DSFDFGREFSALLQGDAWTTIGGDVVHWRDVLLVQIVVAGVTLLALVSGTLATLLHAARGRLEATQRAHSVVVGSAYVLFATLVSIPCIALAAGYPSGRLAIFWLAFGVLWLVAMLC